MILPSILCVGALIATLAASSLKSIPFQKHNNISAGMGAQQIARDLQFTQKAQDTFSIMHQIDAQQQHVGAQQARIRRAYHTTLPAIEEALFNHRCTNPDCEAFTKRQSELINTMLDDLLPVE